MPNLESGRRKSIIHIWQMSSNAAELRESKLAGLPTFSGRIAKESGGQPRSPPALPSPYR